MSQCCLSPLFPDAESCSVLAGSSSGASGSTGDGDNADRGDRFRGCSGPWWEARQGHASGVSRGCRYFTVLSVHLPVPFPSSMLESQLFCRLWNLQQLSPAILESLLPGKAAAEGRREGRQDICAALESGAFCHHHRQLLLFLQGASPGSRRMERCTGRLVRAGG